MPQSWIVHRIYFWLKIDEFETVIRTNLIGAAILAKNLAVQMKKRRWGRIVNVSSGMSSLVRGFGADSPAYRVSKLALNGVSISLAQALKGSGVLVNSVDPGWVRTEMGGKSASRSVEEGAKSVVWAALLSDDGPTGGFFYDGRPADCSIVAYNMTVLNLREILAECAQQREEYETLLRELVEIPSISSDPEREPDVHRAAVRAAELIGKFGGTSSIIHSNTNVPFVHGSFFSSSKKHPIVSVYNHLDVIPASKETEPWKTEPFVFSKQGDRYFGRGTTDDKGPALVALFSARLAQKMGIPINIQLLWECEEEVGSPEFF